MAAAYYEIILKGRPGPAVTHWFPDLEVRSLGPDRVQLVGWLADQAALQGLINNISDFGLELVAVRELPSPGG